MTAISRNLALLAIIWIISWTTACTPAGNDTAPTAREPVAAVGVATAPTVDLSKAADTAANAGYDGPIMKFKARGNEPFWIVEVNGNALIYATPEIQPGKAITAKRLAHAQGANYIGKDGKTKFALDIISKQCQDSMSGHTFEFTASFSYAGQNMHGCAEAVQ